MNALQSSSSVRKLLFLVGALLVRGAVLHGVTVTAFAAVPFVPTLPAQSLQEKADGPVLLVTTTPRRQFLKHVARMVLVSTTAGVLPSASAAAAAAAAAENQDIRITLPQPGTPLGLELVEVTIGTPARSVAAIKSIRIVHRDTRPLQPGMILPDFDTALAVQQRLQNGPYPVTLTFRNLAAGGDAWADDGKPLVTAADALQLAQQQSTTATTSATTSPYQVTQLQSVQQCPIRSRRNDVLEIQYTARYGSSSANAEEGPKMVYDSSQQRGTGQPYQMVLGSGDMIPGVDQALYDMCPGEVRRVQIPPPLGYGPRARAMYRIPEGATLYWNVELVSVNSVRPGSDITSREEMEGRVPYSVQ